MKKKSFVFIGLAFLSSFIYGDSTSAVVKKTQQRSDSQANKVQEVDTVPDEKAILKNAQTIEHANIPGNNHSGEIKEIEVNSVNFIKLNGKANEIFIPNPEVADVDMLSDSSLYLTGLTPGTTSLVVHDKRGNTILNYQVRVTYPLKEIKKAIVEMYPEADVEIVSVDKSVILRGKVASPEIAADVQDIVGRFIENTKIINKLSIETATQVMLKVKIAEVSRTLTKSMGINWRALSHGQTNNAVHYGFISGDASAFPVFTKDLDELAVQLTEENKILGKTLSGGRWLVHAGGGNSLSALIEALASESFASVLAEPTLIALSGETAKFKSGGEVGYEVKQTGNDATTTEFKSWGTELEFTPTVLSEDRIRIKVKPTVSTVTVENSTKGIPSLTTKETTTTVELGSGQSLAIAGLLQTTKNSASSETPFLADIPLIGTLFRNSNVSTSEKELIIIITPYVVKPSSTQLKTPNDMIPRMYSPMESILARKFHKNNKKHSTKDIRKGHSAGFSLV
ncbi:MAG: type II and III secretion system protein family protein [Holosporaceae bacterium]|jgi:pilus assembly protein CpaC|nr:type II and III secretion system protein family protein [Holosporaceae bacterium]